MVKQIMTSSLVFALLLLALVAGPHAQAPKSVTRSQPRPP